MRTTPNSRCPKIVNCAGRIRWAVDPQQQCPLGVLFTNGIQINSATIVTRHSDGTTTGQSGAHFVRWVGNGWI